MSKLVSLWGGRVEGYVADVCAGSGALGFDLMSRGAQHATFVDINIKAVEENAQLLGIASDTYHIIRQDARHTLPVWPHPKPLDVLVTDPPYGVSPIQTWANAWLHWVVADYTIVCIEQETGHVCAQLDGLEFLQQAEYGRATWTVWQRKMLT